MVIDLGPLKAFATSGPVLYGALASAALGIVLGLLVRVGPQTAPSVSMEAYAGGGEPMPEPIALPAGKVPDYMIGTDFLVPTRQRPLQPTDYVYEPRVAQSASVENPPPPIVVAAWPERPARDETRWASTHGDILDVRLPEDVPAIPPLRD
jgi:hypothetical protein